MFLLGETLWNSQVGTRESFDHTVLDKQLTGYFCISDTHTSHSPRKQQTITSEASRESQSAKSVCTGKI